MEGEIEVFLLAESSLPLIGLTFRCSCAPPFAACCVTRRGRSHRTETGSRSAAAMRLSRRDQWYPIFSVEIPSWAGI